MSVMIFELKPRCFLLTGFRRGEVVALNWSDIDFNKQKISINKAAVIAEDGKLLLKEPKTAKSQRTISVPSILMRQLELYRDWQKELIHQLGDLYHDQGFLFTKEDGEIMNPNTFMNGFLKISESSVHSKNSNQKKFGDNSNYFLGNKNMLN